MKIDWSRAAGTRYDLAEDSYGSDRYPVVPDEYGPVHALLFDPPDSRPPRFVAPDWLDRKFHDAVFLERWRSHEAACGRTVRLVFPVPFDTAEDDACKSCLAMASLWIADRQEYDRIVSERHAKRRAEREERENYTEFLARQERGLFDAPKDS